MRDFLWTVYTCASLSLLFVSFHISKFIWIFLLLSFCMLTSSYTNLYPSLFTHYLLISFSASLTLFTLAHLCLFLFSTFACLPNSFAFSAIPLLVYFSSSHNNIHSLILPTHIFFLLSALPTFSSLPTFLPFIVFPLCSSLPCPAAVQEERQRNKDRDGDVESTSAVNEEMPVEKILEAEMAVEQKTELHADGSSGGSSVSSLGVEINPLDVFNNRNNYQRKSEFK